MEDHFTGLMEHKAVQTGGSMKKKKTLKETQEAVEKRLNTLENLIDALRDAVDEQAGRLDQRTQFLSAGILPKSRRLGCLAAQGG